MKTCFYQLEVIDVDSLTEWCGRSEVTIDDIKQGVGYLEITDGHTKVNLLKYFGLQDKISCKVSCGIDTGNYVSITGWTTFHMNYKLMMSLNPNKMRHFPSRCCKVLLLCCVTENCLQEWWCLPLVKRHRIPFIEVVSDWNIKWGTSRFHHSVETK